MEYIVITIKTILIVLGVVLAYLMLSRVIYVLFDDNQEKK